MAAIVPDLSALLRVVAPSASQSAMIVSLTTQQTDIRTAQAISDAAAVTVAKIALAETLAYQKINTFAPTEVNAQFNQECKSKHFFSFSIPSLIEDG